MSSHLDPKHPPKTLEHMTKYLSVLTGAPGPTNFSHHPLLMLSLGGGGEFDSESNANADTIFTQQTAQVS